VEYVYKRTRPRLTVESTGGKNLGNCYGVSFYLVTSTYPLTEDNLKSLFATGAIGYGQEFRHEELEKTFDTTPCIGIDGDREIQNPMNPYSGKPYQPIQEPVYQYRIETRCDSGD